MKRPFFIFLFSLIMTQMTAQNTSLPYAEIPKEPKEFNAGTVASRMVDGLGFRFYWATEGLKEKDLNFKPSEEARTAMETVDHILILSILITNAVTGEEQEFPKKDELTFPQMRERILLNLEKTSKILRESKDLSDFNMNLRGEEYPFWYQINGPIADAIWHTGQLVSFRRSSGNPFPKGVNILRGTKN